MYETSRTRELYHHGVKGMKWGVRRYQNKDGSLTAAGRKRNYRDLFDAEGKEKKEQAKVHADPNRWVREDRERTKRVLDESYQMTNKLKNANDRAMKNKPKQKMDLSEMSDQEMRNQINRALLEKQYNDMFAPQTQSKGREFASKALEVAGDTLAITSSAVGLALAIRQLRSGS